MTTSNNNNYSAVHPLDEQQYTTSSSPNTISFSSAIEFTSTNNNMNTPQTPTSIPTPPTKGGGMGHQQRAYSVTSMPSELQKRHELELQQQKEEKIKHNQPWWQYYYQLYHYHLPPGRKPTVFGPYLLLQTLGEGEFGKVKFGIEVKTGQEVAIKLIRKDSIDSSSRMTKVEREISVLRILHHPNIVELFDVIETEKYIGIILQCATGGELFDYILAHRYLKEKDASRLFAQLISGVHYMHQKHIVHRDLKLENLLLDRHRNVLITDFGFANQFSSPQDDLMSTSCGSPCYAAPELVMNQGVYVGPAVDIWSCGVILFAMLCGYLPYDDDPANPESYNINLLYKYILNTPLIFPDYISDEACDLLSLMLVPDPEKRCSMDQIMNHPWLAPHKHLFVVVSREEQQEEEDLVMEEDEEPTPEPTRRNTIANIHTNSQEEQDQVVPSSTEKIVEEEEPVSAVVASQKDQVMQEESVDKKEEQQAEEDITMQEIISIELPPPTLIEDQQNETTTDNNKKDDTLMTEKETIVPIIVTEQSTEQPTEQLTEQPPAPVTKTEDKEEELHSVSPLPTLTTSTKTTTTNNNKKVRPRSTVSSSTEKVLHFLSGHSNTPKPNSVHVVRNTSNKEKRTRHMSLANGVPTLNNTDPLTVPPSPTATTSTSSILHSKFLSSIQRNKTPHPQEVPKAAAPTPTATSASTPHPTKNKRQVRLSTTVKPSQPVPVQSTEQRETRRKTLSLLVNSMTDNKPFSNRRQSTLKSPVPSNANTPSPPPSSTTRTTAVTKKEEQEQGRKTPKMTPSASEHTMNTLSQTTSTSDSKEKHRSAGKKLMDWFKKKPLSTMHQNNNNNNNRSSSNDILHQQTEESDIKLRIHHGAVDQEALTSRPPAQVFLEVKQTLKALGLEFKRDGGEYKLKCVRPKKTVVTKPTLPMALQQPNAIQQQHGGQTPFRMLLRRSSAAATGATSTTHISSSSSSNGTATTASETKATPATIYGDPNVDPGEEVRFSVELCKIKNLPGLYIVDMRRMRGNVWAYKFIYRTLLDTLNLGGKSGYLNTSSSKESTTVAADTANTTTESGLTSTISSHHRMSMASEELVVIEENEALPATPLTKEIVV